MLFFGIHFHRQRASFGVAQRGLERFGQPLLGIRIHLQPVHHDLDGVFFGFLQRRQGVDFVNLAVDAQPRETLRAQLVEQIQLLALALHHQRRKNHDACAFRQIQHVIDHLPDTLRLQHQIMLRAIRVAGAREQQAQVVVDFGDRADRGTRVMRSGLLLDRDRRRKPLDQVHIRLFHQLQKLPRIGRQRFHIAPLPLGIQGVEGE